MTQTAVIALSLLNYCAAILLLQSSGYTSVLDTAQLNSLALLCLDLHSYGYDLGLILFEVHCLILGYLIAKSLYMPRLLGYLVMAVGVTYLVGSYTRFLSPDFVETLSPIYLIAIISALSLCLWLLVKGVNLEQWEETTGSVGVV
ncbi:DUF4386 domain-containing protein [Nodosilinea sp. AN01ver1]|uniref:DUF4386 domain-containing protein n=1 Tax=Nodosilinea sp. AN01ver1 TaxID=3423362 RepID=UPI003D314A78